MLLTLIGVGVVAAAPVSLALPGFNAVNLAPGEGELYVELLAQKLSELSLKVISSRDIGAVLGLERQRELLGCSDSSCTAELAGALGVDGIVLGDVGLLGKRYAVNLKVLSREGQALALFNGEGAEVRSLISAGARVLAHQLAAALNRPELEPPALTEAAPPPAPRSRLFRPLAIGGIIAGAALLGIGVVCEGAAGGRMTALTQAETLMDAERYRNDGKAFQAAGGALIGIGIAVAVAAAVLWVLSDDPPKSAVAFAGGGRLTVSW